MIVVEATPMSTREWSINASFAGMFKKSQAEPEEEEQAHHDEIETAAPAGKLSRMPLI